MISRFLSLLAALTVLAVGCSKGPVPAGPTITVPTPPAMSTKAPGSGEPKLAPPIAPPAKPTVPERRNVYAAAGAGTFARGVAEDRPLVYVPHNRSGDVWEIDPVTYQVVGKYPVGREIQHVVPAHDMRTLYATDDVGNQMLAFEPAHRSAGPQDPYHRPVQPVLHP
ncbi:MAG TPA: hypothetical protein VEF72_11195 [Mycobacterium sp.]|nr:hypothetical protein [Mycobacterium sp.]